MTVDNPKRPGGWIQFASTKRSPLSLIQKHPRKQQMRIVLSVLYRITNHIYNAARLHQRGVAMCAVVAGTIAILYYATNMLGVGSVIALNWWTVVAVIFAFAVGLKYVEETSKRDSCGGVQIWINNIFR